MLVGVCGNGGEYISILVVIGGFEYGKQRSSKNFERRLRC